MYKISSLDFNIQKIADSGQCFRLNRVENGYRLVAFGRRLNIVEQDGCCLLDCTCDEYNSLWKSYFDMDTDYACFSLAVPKEDGYMRQAVDFGRGIRILKQEPFEMLVSFIISQRKSIPAIKTSVEALCRKFGEQIDEGIFSFPTAQSLKNATFDELAACSLGYRTQYVKDAAELVADGLFALDKLNRLDDDKVLEELMKLKGVGMKVASCVLLFGYHRLDAFPRDVWINRIIDSEYNGEIDLAPYKGFAGVMQQYMFFFARETKSK